MQETADVRAKQDRPGPWSVALAGYAHPQRLRSWDVLRKRTYGSTGSHESWLPSEAHASRTESGGYCAPIPDQLPRSSSCPVARKQTRQRAGAYSTRGTSEITRKLRRLVRPGSANCPRSSVVSTAVDERDAPSQAPCPSSSVCQTRTPGNGCPSRSNVPAAAGKTLTVCASGSNRHPLNSRRAPTAKMKQNRIATTLVRIIKLIRLACPDKTAFQASLPRLVVSFPIWTTSPSLAHPASLARPREPVRRVVPVLIAKLSRKVLRLAQARDDTRYGRGSGVHLGEPCFLHQPAYVIAADATTAKHGKLASPQLHKLPKDLSALPSRGSAP